MPNDAGYEVFVLMEYCSGNGLLSYMNSRLQDQLKEPEILKIACDIGLGIASMHYLSPPLIHRDLKVDNVLISGDGVHKLCDFGSASNVLLPPRNSMEFQMLDNDILNHTTAQYRSPEMVDISRGFPIDEKSDIWAFGVVIYMLCFYRTPFEKEGNMGILNGRYTLPPGPVYSDRLKRVIQVTLSVDPRLRPNIYQCLKELFSMRGLEVPIGDIYTAPTSTVWKIAAPHTAPAATLWKDPGSAPAVAPPSDHSSVSAPSADSSTFYSSDPSSRTPVSVFSPSPSHSYQSETILNQQHLPQSTSPYPQAQHPSSIPASLSSKTATTTGSNVSSIEKSNTSQKAEEEEVKVQEELEEEDAESKYPTIEELSQSMEQQYISVSPSVATTPKTPYMSSASFGKSFTSLPPPINSIPAPMPVNISTQYAAPKPIQMEQNPFSSYGSNNPWGSYTQQQQKSQVVQVPVQHQQQQIQPQQPQQLPSSFPNQQVFPPATFADMAWQTSTATTLPAVATPAPVKSRSHTPSQSYVDHRLSAGASSYVSSSSSSEEENTLSSYPSNINRSNSYSSIKRPPSANRRTPDAPASYYEERLPRPRPASLFLQPSDALLDLSNDSTTPARRSYSKGTNIVASTNSSIPPVPQLPVAASAPIAHTLAMEQNLIDPIVTDEKDQLKALLTEVSENGSFMMLENGPSNADLVKAISQDLTGRSRHNKSPSKNQYPLDMDSGSSNDSSASNTGNTFEQISYIKSRPAHNKKSSLSLKSKINDAFKVFDSTSRSTSSQHSKSAPRTSGEYKNSNGYSKNKRFSYSIDNLSGGYSNSQDSDSTFHIDSRPSAEAIVRQASFMDSEDPSQFERPKQGKYVLTSPKSEANLGSTQYSTRNPVENPAFTIHNRIQAMINENGSSVNDQLGKQPTLPPRSIGYSHETKKRSSLEDKRTALRSSPGSTSSSSSSSEDELPHNSLPKKQLEGGGFYNQTNKSFVTPGSQIVTTTSTPTIATTTATAPTATANLMDDRSPGINEEWKEVFNKKYPSLA